MNVSFLVILIYILLPTNNVLVNALRNFEHALGLKQLIVELRWGVMNYAGV